MRYRRLSPEGDMVAGHGNMDFLRDTDAVAQAVKTRLLLLWAEWWENENDGLPLFEKILGQFGARNIRNAELIIKERIRTTRNVISVNNLRSTLNERVFHVWCDVDTAFGTTHVEVSA